MGARIELLGRVRLLIDGVESKSGHTSLMCLLALRPNERLHRSEIAQILYPDELRPAANNRIRVGLSRLRDCLPILETEETVQLDRRFVEVDIDSVRESLRSNELATDAERFGALAAIVDHLAKPLLPGIQEPWADAERTAWELEAVEGLARLAELADQLNDWQMQRTAAETGLDHLPQDEEFWSHALRASARLGDAPNALKNWSQSRRALQADGGDYSPELIELAGSLKDRADPNRASFGTSEESLLIRLAERCAREDPQALLGLLASPSFAIEAKRSPDAALRILDLALDHAVDGNLTAACQVARIATLGFLDRYAEAIVDGTTLLDSNLRPLDRQRLLNTLSFGCVFAGDLEQGLKYLDDLLALCEREGWEHEGWIAKCSHASCLWRLTRFEESDRLFGQCTRYFESVEGRDVGAFLAVAKSNWASLLADLDRVGESAALAIAADSLARKIGSTDTACRTAATLARVGFGLGNLQDGIGHAKRSVRYAVRHDSIRLHANTLENVGMGLIQGGQRELGAELVSAGWGIRLAHVLPTDALFDWRREKFGMIDAAPAPIPDSRSALVSAFRRLESLPSM